MALNILNRSQGLWGVVTHATPAIGASLTPTHAINNEDRICPYCNRVMSVREKVEQGMCNECIERA